LFVNRQALHADRPTVGTVNRIPPLVGADARRYRPLMSGNWVTAKMFRFTLLMSGKRPTFSAVVRLIRAA